MTSRELSKLWCSMPTLGDVDSDVVAFGMEVQRQALERAAEICYEHWKYEMDAGLAAKEIRALLETDK